MNEVHDMLANMLFEKNGQLSYDQARTWVELMWEDFESTYAKAGYQYKGSEMTERIVRQWIELYGDKLHDFVAKNPKYKHFLKTDDNQLH
jgi:hypothetical protein